MDFDTFESRAHAMWAEIPDTYKEGIDGIVVKRDPEEHPEYPEYYTMGMCFTEPYPSGYMGPDTTRSILAVYWGSFRKVAERGEGFDWEEELWETITHELRHHLEFLAEDDALEGLDYAMEETYKRSQGETFDPWYWQHGPLLAPGVHRVEYDVYLEMRITDDVFASAEQLEFDWDGGRWAVPLPEELGDIHWIWIHGVETAGGWLQLVLVRERPFLARLKRVLGSKEARELDLLESEADAVRIGDAPGSPGPLDGRPGRAAGGPPPATGSEGQEDQEEGDEDHNQGDGEGIPRGEDR
jgi:hypothetical protein